MHFASDSAHDELVIGAQRIPPSEFQICIRDGRARTDGPVCISFATDASLILKKKTNIESSS